MKPVVIFDIDKTLVNVDLPEYLYKNKIFKKKIYLNKIFCIIIFYFLFKITRWKIRRRFEYWYEVIIDSDRLCEIINSKKLYNSLIYRRVLKYIKLGYDVYFVTAGPKSISSKLFKYHNVKIVCSETYNGFIINDLLGKKEEKVYKKIIYDSKIIAIYSDSKLDHSLLSRYNYIVADNSISLTKLISQ